MPGRSPARRPRHAPLVGAALQLDVPGTPRIDLEPLKPLAFRARQFPDITFEFVLDGERVTGMKQIDPSGEAKLVKVK